MTTQGGGTRRDRRHVLFLGHGAERTGPPILLGHLLAGLAADGYDRSVLVARDGPLAAEYRAHGARVTAVGPGREPLEPLAAGLRRMGAERLAAAVQERRRHRVAARVGPLDLVYVNAATPPTAALLRALDLQASVPVILHVHELDVGLRRTLDEVDRTALFARATAVIAASGAVAELLVDGHGVSEHDLTVCDEFIDVSAVRPRPASEARRILDVPLDAQVIGSVGLPDWRKDPEHLVRAVHALRTSPGGRDLDPWIVWIGGDPDSSDGRHLADEVARLGLADRFRHVRHVDRPGDLLGALDVFALPAREDALPLAALEAAAAARPLVCFRTGGVAALCDAGAGIAVDYPDTAAFAAALRTLLVDRAAATAAGDSGAAIVREHHDLAPGVARIRAVIDQQLAGTDR